MAEAWRELDASEIRSALAQRSGAGLPAWTGFLDTHQWSPMLGDSAVVLLAPFAEAQFRLAGLVASAKPVMRLVRMPVTQLDRSQQSPRALRRWLETRLPQEACLGDLTIAGDNAQFALADCELNVLPAGMGAIEAHVWEVPDAARALNVASLRLDALISRLFNVSRGEASIAITHGFVFVDFSPALKPSRTVTPGSSIVFRGKGRAKLLAAQDNPRSGRVNIACAQYPV